LLRSLTCCLLVILLWKPATAQDFSPRDVEQLIQRIQKSHIQPRPIDAAFSNLVFGNVFSELDNDGLLFSEKDIDQFSAYEDRVVTPGGEADTIFIRLLHELYSKKVQSFMGWSNRMMLTTPVYQESEFWTSQERDAWAASESALELKRKRWLKFEILQQLASLHKLTATGAAFVKEEAAIRSRILKSRQAQLQKTLQATGRQHVFLCLMKAVASAFDPHTNFFTNTESQQFEDGLSGERASFGFSTKRVESGEVSVAQLIPAGAAWNSQQINPGDIIISVAQHGREQQTADVSDEAWEELMVSPEVTEAVFRIRKPDGTIQSVPLTKTLAVNEENVISAFLLMGKRRIGYIALPSFFSNWEDENKTGCANEVAKAIIKLQKENIEGLVLDLRYNGGGSLLEALNLAGIFIDVGPLGILLTRGKPAETMKDMTRGTIYNGPLLIMVNGFSASASELLAATLQDHNRALIVGSPTFGKATGQVVEAGIRPGSTLKITVDRIYRINGTSYQQRGVVPVVSIPDVSTYLPYREKSLPGSLNADSINKKTYYTPLASFPTAELQQASKSRYERLPHLGVLNDLIHTLTAPVPLDMRQFTQHHSRINTLQETSRIPAAERWYRATIPNFDATVLQMDGYRAAMVKATSEQIEQSPYIHEAFAILNDYIEFLKKK
jgi:carboxyl-terminal processing protease